MTEMPTGSEREDHMATQFAALGRFIQEFENAVDAFRIGTRFMADEGKPSILAMVLEHSALTAGPLFEIWRAVLAVRCKQGDKPYDADAELKGRDVAKEFGDLIKRRNEIVHGTWFIGWGGEKTDWSKIHAEKGKLTSEGFRRAEMPSSANELNALSDRAASLAKSVLAISIGKDVQRAYKSINGVWSTVDAKT